MNIIRYDGGTDGTRAYVHLSLSRRNLDTLLRMLDTKVGAPTLHRTPEEEIHLFVTAEENEDHYHERRAPQGVGPEHI